MIGLLQRVRQARVTVGEETVGAIGPGLLVLLGVEKEDGTEQARRLARRILDYRVFADADGRMNLDVAQVGGGVLVVPQFTLAADTRKGNRPSFTPAAEPAHGEALYQCLVAELRRYHPRVETGRFGAHMAVSLVNDGPVTFWLQARPAGRLTSGAT